MPPGLFSLVAQLFPAASFYLAVALRMLLVSKENIAKALLKETRNDGLVGPKGSNKIDLLKYAGRNVNVLKSSLS